MHSIFNIRIYQGISQNKGDGQICIYIIISRQVSRAINNCSQTHTHISSLHVSRAANNYTTLWKQWWYHMSRP